MGHHVHTIRSHQLGWQAGPTLTPMHWACGKTSNWQVLQSGWVPTTGEVPSTDEHVGEPRHTHQTSHHDWGQVPQHGWNSSLMQWDPWTALSPSPSPSPDHGFDSDSSALSTSSSVSSCSGRSGGSRLAHHRCCHREPGGHMKINQPVFKDEDKKDAITYQSWHWDLMVYYHAGCQDHTIFLYIICSLQGYPRELVRSLGTEATLDGLLTILD